MTASAWIITTLLTLTFFVVTSSGAAFPEVIDLSYEYTRSSIGLPIHPAFIFTVVQRGQSPIFNRYLEYNKFETGEHRGTHSDAPAHFAQGHWRSHEIPPSHLIGPGVVIDVSAKAENNATYKMTVDDVKAWEEEHGRIPDGAVVLMNSGWGKRYPDPLKVYNTTDIFDTSTYVFPSFHPDLGKFLAEERNITAAGGDAPSPDNRDPALSNHVALLSNNILILENVANVDQLPPTGTTIIIGMIKLYDGSGGPSRILALKGTNWITGAGHPCSVASVAVVTVSFLSSVLLRFVL